MALSEELTGLSEAARAFFIDALSREADSEMPATAPARYAAMTWDDARRLERRGVAFAPHTVTHPILPRTTDADAAWQIPESWRSIQKQVARPLPIFAYPNGDYIPRDMDIVGRAGLTGAVTSRPGYVHVAQFDQPTGRFSIPRFPYPDYYPEAVCLTATGLHEPLLRPGAHSRSSGNGTYALHIWRPPGRSGARTRRGSGGLGSVSSLMPGSCCPSSTA